MSQSRFKAEVLSLRGVLCINPSVFSDERGVSVTTYSADEFEAFGIHPRFVEGFTSRSRKDVIRGLHFQYPPYAQDKLVRCSQGEVFAVVVDYEKTSPTYRQHVSVTLSSETQNILFVPGQYAFGFCVTSDEALVEYKLGDSFHPEAAGGVFYNDPALGISWPVTNPVLSQKDRDWPLLSYEQK